MSSISGWFKEKRNYIWAFFVGVLGVVQASPGAGTPASSFIRVEQRADLSADDLPIDQLVQVTSDAPEYMAKAAETEISFDEDEVTITREDLPDIAEAVTGLTEGPKDVDLGGSTEMVEEGGNGNGGQGNGPRITTDR